MTILHSLPTALLLGAAVILTIWGTVKQGRVLSFFGALLGTATVVSALVEGARLRECLVYLLLLLLLSLPRKGGERP